MKVSIELRRGATGHWYYSMPGWKKWDAPGFGPFPCPKVALNAAIYRLDDREPDGGTHIVAAALATTRPESGDAACLIYPAEQVARAFRAQGGAEPRKRPAPLLAPVEAGGSQLNLI